jgi:threonine aldolase
VDSRKSFGSDNYAGAHESVIRVLAQANTGDASAYGADPWTGRAAAALSDAFGARGGVFFVFTGTGANVLGLSLLLRPYEAVICPQTAHVNVDECGAIERILGNRLLATATPDGKLTPGLIAPRLEGRGDEHRAQPRVVAISQVTELGTCYTLDELKALREFCQAEELRLYVDGARLANAAARLDCSLADLAAHADVLSFGGTKNGAIGAEAVVVMAEELTADAPFLRKQQTQLASKMRYLSAQFLGLMEDQLWLHNARHANAMAARLAEGIRNVPGVELWQAVEANAVFARLLPAHMARLQRVREFYEWDPSAHVVRWMTAFDTTEIDVDAFVADVHQTAGGE